MAKLLLITEKQYRPGENEIGDVVGVFPDNHVFSDKERAVFYVAEVAELKTVIDAMRPQLKRLYKAKTLEYTETPPEEIKAWRDERGDWRLIKKEPLYAFRFEDGEIKENYSRYRENDEVVSITGKEIKELLEKALKDKH